VRVGDGFAGFVRRAAFALRFGDVNPLVSGNIRPDSRVLIERDISGRLQAVAPFLAYDHDPYVVVTDGSVKYVVDAYTTSSQLPQRPAGRYRRARRGQRPAGPIVQLRAQLGEGRGRRL
jgi:uncharacterized membrane protein (UPF0182 family)